MFVTYPNSIVPSNINKQVDFTLGAGSVLVAGASLDGVFQLNLDYNAVPVNNTDILFPPYEKELRANGSYIFIYNAGTQKWGRIAIDTSNW